MLNRRTALKAFVGCIAAIGLPVGTTTAEFKIVNDYGPCVPELWARESLKILEENMVVGNLVHKDFEQQIGFVLMDERLDTVRLG